MITTSPIARRVWAGACALCLLVLVVPPSPSSAGPTPTCGGEPATIVGTDGNDTLRGTRGDDLIVARGGDDFVKSFGGSDRICGGSGADRIEAGSGFQDIVYAGSGNDVVHGGRGRNLLIAGPGRDRMYGSSHFDTFESPGRKWDADVDLFVGRGRRDSFSADPGNDTFKGGPGKDQVWFHQAPSGIELDLGAGTSSGDGRDTLSSIEHATGTRHGDTITGSGLRNRISSGTGNDTVYGRGGNDELYDFGGRDHIEGGAGRDDISSSFCSGSSDGDTECQTDPPLPDSLIGGPGNDSVGSGPGDDRVSGGRGNDWLFGGDGADRIFGGEGDDRLHGGNAAGSDPEADDGDTDELDGGPGMDQCSGPGDNFRNCESP